MEAHLTSLWRHRRYGRTLSDGDLVTMHSGQLNCAGCLWQGMPRRVQFCGQLRLQGRLTRMSVPAKRPNIRHSLKNLTCLSQRLLDNKPNKRPSRGQTRFQKDLKPCDPCSILRRLRPPLHLPAAAAPVNAVSSAVMLELNRPSSNILHRPATADAMHHLTTQTVAPLADQILRSPFLHPTLATAVAALLR